MPPAQSAGRVQFAGGAPAAAPTTDRTEGVDGFLSWLAAQRETPQPVDEEEETEDIGALIEAAIDELGDDPPRRWMDLDDSDHVAEITNRIYNELSARLRFDLLVERERAGSLMDRN